MNFIPDALEQVTTKDLLAELKLPFVPPAFIIPKDLAELQDYAANNPQNRLLAKPYTHHHIR